MRVKSRKIDPRAERRREKNLNYLMLKARKQAIAKGHQPGRWRIWSSGTGAIAQCKRCEMPFGCLSHPYPMEEAVSGTALFYDCPKKPWWGAKSNKEKGSK